MTTSNYPVFKSRKNKPIMQLTMTLDPICVARILEYSALSHLSICHNVCKTRTIISLSVLQSYAKEDILEFIIAMRDWGLVFHRADSIRNNLIRADTLYKLETDDMTLEERVTSIFPKIHFCISASLFLVTMQWNSLEGSWKFFSRYQYICSSLYNRYTILCCFQKSSLFQAQLLTSSTSTTNSKTTKWNSIIMHINTSSLLYSNIITTHMH